MRKTFTAAIAAVTLIGGLAAAADASAQRRYRDNDNDAAAAAIAGFALGAALSGNGRVVVGSPDYGYRHRPYGYYPRPYYGRRCWTERFWDPYYGRVERRVCR